MKLLRALLNDAQRSAWENQHDPDDFSPGNTYEMINSSWVRAGWSQLPVGTEVTLRVIDADPNRTVHFTLKHDRSRGTQEINFVCNLERFKHDTVRVS